MSYFNKLSEARIDVGKSSTDKVRARSRRDFDRAFIARSDGSDGRGGLARDHRKTNVMAARSRRRSGRGDSGLGGQSQVERKLKAESYIRIGYALLGTKER